MVGCTPKTAIATNQIDFRARHSPPLILCLFFVFHFILLYSVQQNSVVGLELDCRCMGANASQLYTYTTQCRLINVRQMYGAVGTTTHPFNCTTKRLFVYELYSNWKFQRFSLIHHSVQYQPLAGLDIWYWLYICFNISGENFLFFIFFPIKLCVVQLERKFNGGKRKVGFLVFPNYNRSKEDCNLKFNRSFPFCLPNR